MEPASILYAELDEVDSELDTWPEPPGLPSGRGWIAVWDSLHDMYGDNPVEFSYD